MFKIINKTIRGIILLHSNCNNMLIEFGNIRLELNNKDFRTFSKYLLTTDYKNIHRVSSFDHTRKIIEIESIEGLSSFTLTKEEFHEFQNLISRTNPLLISDVILPINLNSSQFLN